MPQTTRFEVIRCCMPPSYLQLIQQPCLQVLGRSSYTVAAAVLLAVAAGLAWAAWRAGVCVCVCVCVCVGVWRLHTSLCLGQRLHTAYA